MSPALLGVLPFLYVDQVFSKAASEKSRSNLAVSSISTLSCLSWVLFVIHFFEGFSIHETFYFIETLFGWSPGFMIHKTQKKTTKVCTLGLKYTRESTIVTLGSGNNRLIID